MPLFIDTSNRDRISLFIILKAFCLLFDIHQIVNQYLDIEWLLWGCIFYKTSVIKGLPIWVCGTCTFTVYWFVQPNEY